MIGNGLLEKACGVYGIIKGASMCNPRHEYQLTAN